MLAHFVGDIHQPLHVGAIYLDANGAIVDPKSTAEAEDDSTQGGNLIAVDKSKELHAEWDGITQSSEKSEPHLVTAAAKISIEKDAPFDRSAPAWASESVSDAANAFNGITFTETAPHKWHAIFSDRSAYLRAERALQKKKIIEAAGRLAAVFENIWP